MINLMGGSIKKLIPEGDYIKSILFIFVIFFVKVYLVQYSYNIIIPKISKDFGNNNIIAPLSFTHAIFLVILFSNLFR